MVTKPGRSKGMKITSNAKPTEDKTMNKETTIEELLALDEEGLEELVEELWDTTPIAHWEVSRSRWTRRKASVYPLGDRFFAIYADEGLTEQQEDSDPYYAINEVIAVTETVTRYVTGSNG